MKKPSIFFIIVICFFKLQSCWGQVDAAWPGNDVGALTCSGSPYSYTGNTSGANVDCGVSDAGDHIYQFTIDVDADVEISLCNAGTDFDTQMYLFNLSNGDCDSGDIDYNDDGSGCGTESKLIETGLAAGTYVIVIEGWSSNEGNYELSIALSNCQTSGDTPCEAKSETTSCGAKTILSNSGLGDSGFGAPSCGIFTGGDLWVTVLVPASGSVDVDTKAGTLTDIAMEVYRENTDCSDALTTIGCDDNSGNGNMPKLTITGETPGNTLYIRLWDNNNDETGNFELEVSDPSNLYCLTNNASMYNFPSDTCMQVTADVGSQKGCAWYQNTIDFSNDFDHTLEVYLGSHDGGDGMTFTFHNDPDGTTDCGSSGAGLGASGLSNAVVIEIDTYDNDDPGHTWDLADDHIAVYTSISGYMSPIAGPIVARSSAPLDIEDGAVHTMRITWNATTYNMEIYFDGVFRLSVNNDFVTNVFGSQNVFWGSTGSTGGVTNQQYVCPPVSLINPEILPIELKEFTGVCHNDKVVLKWITRSELKNDYFILQKSILEDQFIDIAKINGAGTSSIENNYEWQDNTVYNNSYYRIKQVDFDGDISYTNIISVKCEEDKTKKDLLIYPNPIQQGQILFTNSSIDTKLVTYLFDEIGRFVTQLNIDNQTEVNLLPGVYFLKIIESDGNNKYQKLVVSNK